MFVDWCVVCCCFLVLFCNLKVWCVYLLVWLIVFGHFGVCVLFLWVLMVWSFPLFGVVRFGFC